MYCSFGFIPLMFTQGAGGVINTSFFLQVLQHVLIGTAFQNNQDITDKLQTIEHVLFDHL